MKILKLSLSLLILVAFTVGLYLFSVRGDSDDSVFGDSENFSVTVPGNYAQPLGVKAGDFSLNISPVNAQESDKISPSGQDLIKYRNAYQGVDVEQVWQTDKFKESLILKTPSHPETFEYEINTQNLIWEVVENGDIIFKQKEKEKQMVIGKKEDGFITASLDTNYGDGHPKVFKIPAPFLVDAKGNRSEARDVRVEIENDKLILTPNSEWLKDHAYPIILDPTIENIKEKKELEKVEFGDPQSADFKPKMKLYKWGDEAYVSLEYQTSETGEVEIEGNKVSWGTDGNVSVDMYPVEGTEINNKSGFEFDVIFNEKPENNVVSYKLESKDLDFFYQPSLTEEITSQEGEIVTATEYKDKDGNVIANRPENVVGSYAVYHNSKEGDFTNLGGKNYAVGKAFHIYRPKVYDSAGNWVWGELNIDADENLLTVTIPQEFLDSATYPLTVDPTFGCDPGSPGASNYGVTNYLTGSSYACSEAGTATSISAYIVAGSAAGRYIQSGIYNNDDSLNGYSNSIDSTTNSAWNAMTMASGGSLSAANFWLVWRMSNSLLKIAFDTTGGTSAYDSTVPWDNWIDPWVRVGANGAYKWSLYTTYTSANATPTISTVTDTPDPQKAGLDVKFTVDWNDADAGDLVKAHMCKTDVISGGACTGGSWVSSSTFGTTDPIILYYQSARADEGTKDYYAFVCDDDDACSSSTSGTFTVFLANYFLRGNATFKGSGTFK